MSTTGATQLGNPSLAPHPPGLIESFYMGWAEAFRRPGCGDAQERLQGEGAGSALSPCSWRGMNCYAGHDWNVVCPFAANTA